MKKIPYACRYVKIFMKLFWGDKEREGIKGQISQDAE